MKVSIVTLGFAGVATNISESFEPSLSYFEKFYYAKLQTPKIVYRRSTDAMLGESNEDCRIRILGDKLFYKNMHQLKYVKVPIGFLPFTFSVQDYTATINGYKSSTAMVKMEVSSVDLSRYPYAVLTLGGALNAASQ